MMRDATPRSARATYNRPTRYEIAAVHPDGREVTVGFTMRQTRHGLLRMMQSRGDELIELTDPTVDYPMRFERDAAGRWHTELGGWRVGFTGRTEKEVRDSVSRADTTTTA